MISRLSDSKSISLDTPIVYIQDSSKNTRMQAAYTYMYAVILN